MAKEARTTTMAITTKSSMSVNALRNVAPFP
jgi:hypothetical protein